MFLGIPDPAIWLAYLLVILGAILCIVYGAMNWDKGGNVSALETSEEKTWLKEEIEIEEKSDGGIK